MLSGKFASSLHVKSLEKLSDLQVEGCLALLLMKLGDLALNFFHNLNFTFKELCKGANGVITAFFEFSNMKWLLSLFNLAYEPASDLFLSARDNEVQELFIGYNRLVIVRHQVH